MNEGYSASVKRKRIPRVQTKNRTEEEPNYSTDEDHKPQRKPRIRNRRQIKTNYDLMSKMAMVI